MRDDQHDPDRVDFSALGPPLAADRLEALVSAAVQRSSDELTRRAATGGVIRIVVAWRRLVLAISALAAAAAIVIIAGRPVSRAPIAIASRAPATIAEALGIPAAYAYEVETGTRP